VYSFLELWQFSMFLTVSQKCWKVTNHTKNSCTCVESKCGAVLRIESTAVTNDITDEKRLANQPTFTDDHIT